MLLRLYGISVSMQPHYMLRKALVHMTKWKRILLAVSCTRPVTIGKQAENSTRDRMFYEQQKDAKNVPQVYIRSEQKSSHTCFNKSAVTNYIIMANHVIDWEGASS